jgi:hypothetical protein
LTSVDHEIHELSERLQADLLLLTGRRPGPVPPIRAELLMPLALGGVVVLLFVLLPTAKRRVFLRWTLQSISAFQILSSSLR